MKLKRKLPFNMNLLYISGFFWYETEGNESWEIIKSEGKG